MQAEKTLNSDAEKLKEESKKCSKDDPKNEKCEEDYFRWFIVESTKAYISKAQGHMPEELELKEFE
jgi:hypothetical protein